ncbi:hypothetical protein ACMBCN_03105, partial [Candidatus Liberibacter asiaticus]
VLVTAHLCAHVKSLFISSAFLLLIYGSRPLSLPPPTFVSSCEQSPTITNNHNQLLRATSTSSSSSSSSSSSADAVAVAVAHLPHTQQRQQRDLPPPPPPL